MTAVDPDTPFGAVYAAFCTHLIGAPAISAVLLPGNVIRHDLDDRERRPHTPNSAAAPLLDIRVGDFLITEQNSTSHMVEMSIEVLVSTGQIKLRRLFQLWWALCQTVAKVDAAAVKDLPYLMAIRLEGSPADLSPLGGESNDTNRGTVEWSTVATVVCHLSLQSSLLRTGGIG